MALQEDDAFKKVLKVAQKAFKTLYEKGTYKPSDSLEVEAYRELTTITAGVLQKGITHEVPAELKNYLDKDVFVFSGLKTHAQLTEARSYLKDEKGNVRSYKDFERLITKLNGNYNRNYLESEYLFATSSAQSASNWHQFSDDTKRYYLQYRTASDDRVRDSHRVLHNVTLPKDDPFWDYYYTPNGWRCRCQVIEVLANKNTKSNSLESMAKGDKATTLIGKNGKANKLFQFNPGKTKTVFPPNHAYSKVVGAKEVEKVLKKGLTDRYANYSFEKSKEVKGKGVLEIFTTGKQNPHEFKNNKEALLILANKGDRYRMLPVIEDGSKNPDAFNLDTKELVDVKVPTKTNGKNIVQSGFKEASSQGASEIILHLKNKPDSYRDMFIALKNTIKQNRGKGIKSAVVIYPNGNIKKYDIEKFRKKLNNKGAN
ncbi:hypothetical protein BWK58_06355 [Flavobacterium columnare]|nr:hypothetical protein BWK58_06355 [Flavobacterium columnare]